RPNQGEHGAACRRLPGFEKEAHQPRAKPVESRREQGRDGDRWVEGEVDGGDEDTLLGFEVVEDELGVNLRGRRDAPNRRAVEADTAEIRSGRALDLVPRARFPRP